MSKRNKNLPAIALWNPTWIAIWSFIFTPIFGAILHKKNWQEMGMYDDANTAGTWVTVSIVIFFGYLFTEPFLPEGSYSQFYLLSVWVIFYAAWLFAQGFKQIQVIKKRYGEAYHHKLWGKPLMIGAGGMMLWLAISLTYIIILILSGIIKTVPVN